MLDLSLSLSIAPFNSIFIRLLGNSIRKYDLKQLMHKSF